MNKGYIELIYIADATPIHGKVYHNVSEHWRNVRQFLYRSVS